MNKTIPYIGGKIEIAFDKATEATPVAIQIYDDIGKDPWTGEGFSAKDMAAALNEITPRGRELNISINSRGGDVNEGKAIRSLLEDWPGRIVSIIDGVAASTASWMIPADEVRARNHSQIFIHKSWMLVAGNSDDLGKAIQMLDITDQQIAEIYSKKTGKDADAMMQLMADETLLTGKAAKDLGLVDTLIDGDAVHNFSAPEILNMKRKLAALNQISAPKSGADSTATNHTHTTMSTPAPAVNPPAIDPQITELRNQLKLERDARITSAFNTIAATRPTLNREEWLPKCLNDESVLQLAQKFPESPVGGGLAFNRVEMGGNPLVEQFNAAKYDHAKRAKLVKAHYADLRNELIKIQPGKDVIFNQNTVDATLANTILSGDFITTMRTKTAILSAFAHKVEIAPLAPRDTIKIELVSSAGAVQTNPTSFETGDTTSAPITVSVDHINRNFHVSLAERNVGLALAAKAPTNAKIISEALVASLTARMTNANFGADNIIGTAANFNEDDLPAILRLGKNYPSIGLLLEGDHYYSLAPRTRDNFRPDEGGQYMFDGGIWKNNLWTNAATDIAGLVFGPDALVWGSAPTAVLPQGEFLTTSDIALDCGAVVQAFTWFSRASRSLWGSFDIAFGSAVGDATQAEILTTQ